MLRQKRPSERFVRRPAMVPPVSPPEGLKIKAGDHTEGEFARSVARSNPPTEAWNRRCDGGQTYSDKVIRLSGWRDLNSRPLDPQSSALPSCATARGAALEQ